MFAIVLLAGCGRLNYQSVPDDARVERDGGDIDAGSVDAGPALDASRDAAPADAPPGDAAFVDAGDCVTGTHAGHEYAFCPPAVPRDDASARCAALGMHLVRVDDAAEEAFLETLAGGTDAWIGANDRALDGTWAWDDGTVFYVFAPGGGTVVGGAYEQWGTAEPNGFERENCAALLGVRIWIDWGCEQLAAGLCESP